MDFLNNRCYGCKTGMNYTLTNEGRCIKDLLSKFESCGIFKDNECYECRNPEHVMVRQTSGKIVC